jgi:hypothetical protein
MGKKYRRTKGEARRQLCGCLRFENEIIRIAVERARKDILDKEDRRIFEELSLNGVV